MSDVLTRARLQTGEVSRAIGHGHGAPWRDLPRAYGPWRSVCAGKLSPADKRRFYQTARGSATESAALLDACQRVRLITEADHRLGKEILLRLVSMLVKLTRSFETQLVPEKV